MKDVQEIRARLLARHLCAEGEAVFVSPGARNAPLTLAFAVMEGVRCEVVNDERSAGFMALGYSKVSGRPSILVCTSGSAAGHYLPTVMEASAAGVPLILLTADRPADLHHCGASQTIEQDTIFDPYVRFRASIPVMRDPVDDGWIIQLAQRARTLAQSCPGPVHLNVQLAKPLLSLSSRPTLRPAPNSIQLGKRHLDAADLSRLSEHLAAPRGLVVCGPPRTNDVVQTKFCTERSPLRRSLCLPNPSGSGLFVALRSERRTRHFRLRPRPVTRRAVESSTWLDPMFWPSPYQPSLATLRRPTRQWEVDLGQRRGIPTGSSKRRWRSRHRRSRPALGGTNTESAASSLPAEVSGLATHLATTRKRLLHHQPARRARRNPPASKALRELASQDPRPHRKQYTNS